MNVKSIVFNVTLEEEENVEQPISYVIRGKRKKERKKV